VTYFVPERVPRGLGRGVGAYCVATRHSKRSNTAGIVVRRYKLPSTIWLVGSSGSIQPMPARATPHSSGRSITVAMALSRQLGFDCGGEIGTSCHTPSRYGFAVTEWCTAYWRTVGAIPSTSRHCASTVRNLPPERGWPFTWDTQIEAILVGATARTIADSCNLSARLSGWLTRRISRARALGQPEVDHAD